MPEYTVHVTASEWITVRAEDEDLAVFAAIQEVEGSGVLWEVDAIEETPSDDGQHD